MITTNLKRSIESAAEQIPGRAQWLVDGLDDALASRRADEPSDPLLDALDRAAVLRDQVDELVALLVRQARVEQATWAQIGDALGVSKQAVQQRFGS